MKEELSQKLIQSLDKVQEYIEATEDFVIEQAPLIAQEIVTLGQMESLWPVVWSGTILVVASLLIVFSLTKIVGAGINAEPFSVMCFISAMVWLVSMAVFVNSVGHTFEPWFAPRVYLLHEIAKLL